MFSVGDMVVYGGEGVCRIENIAPATIVGVDKSRLYYYLNPFGRSGQVMTPVDTRVMMRPIMSKEEAEQLISDLPHLDPEQIPVNNMRAIKEFYQDVVSSYDCRRLAELVLTTSRKKALAIENGKKVSQLDERYLKRAQEQLYSELGAALGMELKTVEDYICKSNPQWPKK